LVRSKSTIRKADLASAIQPVFTLLSEVSLYQDEALLIIGLTISREGGQRIQDNLGCCQPRSPTQRTVTCQTEEYWLLSDSLFAVKTVNAGA
jgi:hypothetical protein